MRNKILVVGGNFANAGAEAMTYVTVYELKKRFPEFEIVMCDYIQKGRLENDSSYFFTIHNDSKMQREYVTKSKNIKFITKRIVRFSKFRIKKILKREAKYEDVRGFQNHLRDAVAVVDISGYALGSNWPESNVIKYKNLILACKKYNTNLYFMPQSFGPFEYTDECLDVLNKVLPLANLIFVRELNGYEQMKSLFNLENLITSTDLVLQNNFVNYSELLIKLENSNLDIKSNENVAIIPNQKVFDKCDNTYLLRLYKDIVDELLSLNKNVYILRHSKEDITSAKMIKEMYSDNNKVTLIEEQFPSYQFEEIVQKFDYIIASRYHSIVHAYKNNVPAIAIGWAVKYVELLGNFKQSRCIFDVRTEIKTSEIVDAIKHMNDNYLEEKKVIAEVLIEVQKNNCFDMVEKDLKSILNK